VKYQDLFLKLQTEARETGRGLWAQTPSTPQPIPTTPSSSGKYIGSINSNKYHYPTCSSAKQILPKNLIWFTSAADAKSKGYSPCGGCKPPLND
jgi:micrococcal nuclease